MQQIPFPNAFKYDWADETSPDYSDEKCFQQFLAYLREQGVEPQQVAGIITETFQGGCGPADARGICPKTPDFCTEK